MNTSWRPFSKATSDHQRPLLFLSFFFVVALLCAPNKIIVKFLYPLPLIPAAIEHLKGAKIFTELDLRNAYNLIWILKGDEWKMAFVVPTGHFKYCTISYGLINAPSVFRDFMQEVVQEFLHHVVVYIDDILIHSQSLAEHHQHVVEVR